jgi:hypothetical protein
MKKALRIFFVFMLFQSVATAQLYFTGIGIRAGKFNSGLSYKRFFDADNSIGMQIDLYYTHIADDGFTIKGFYLRQMPFKVPIIQLPLDFVVGPGLHAGFFPLRTQGGGYYKIVDGERVPYNKDVVAVGVDATFQLEYKVPFRNAPFTFGFDCTPFYEFIHRGPEWIDFGFTVRYVFR